MTAGTVENLGGASPHRPAHHAVHAHCSARPWNQTSQLLLLLNTLQGCLYLVKYLQALVSTTFPNSSQDCHTQIHFYAHCVISLYIGIPFTTSRPGRNAYYTNVCMTFAYLDSPKRTYIVTGLYRRLILLTVILETLTAQVPIDEDEDGLGFRIQRHERGLVRSSLMVLVCYTRPLFS